MDLEEAADSCDDELTAEQAETLMDHGLHSPGPVRGADEPEDIRFYPEDPNCPFTLFGHLPQTDMCAMMDRGDLVLLTKNWAKIMPTSEDARQYTLEDLRKQYLFVLTKEPLGAFEFFNPGESIAMFEFRQRARIIQARACDMKDSYDKTVILQSHLRGENVLSPVDFANLMRARYLILHKLLIRTTIDPRTNRITRMERPRPRCKPCENLDPRFEVYCDDCYKHLNIFL